MEIDLSQEDYSQVEERKVIEEGEYTLECIDCTTGVTKNAKGTYWKASFKVVDGDWKNWRVWHYFNVINENKKAEIISRSQLKQFFGDKKITPEMLIGKTVRATIGIRNDAFFGKSNHIKFFNFQAKEDVPELGF